MPDVLFGNQVGQTQWLAISNSVPPEEEDKGIYIIVRQYVCHSYETLIFEEGFSQVDKWLSELGNV